MNILTVRKTISDALYALAKAIRPGFKSGQRVTVNNWEYRGSATIAARYPHAGWHDTVCVTLPDGNNIYVQEHTITKDPMTL